LTGGNAAFSPQAVVTKQHHRLRSSHLGEPLTVPHLLQVDDLKIHFPIKKGLLSKTAGHVYAVDGVSLRLKRGQTLGLVGESGCGKTTTGLGILRLIPVTSGRITYNGEDIYAAGPDRLRTLRRELQIIFQDPYSSLNPRMTVNQILADPMEIHGVYPGKERSERIAYLLEKVGLPPEHGRRFPHEFSGGQRQRIGIARALALNPSLIIGDEPVSALDVSIQAQIINLLIDLQAEFGLSYVIIAHDLAVVEHICDHVAVMYLGRVVERGTHRQLYTSPKHPYTQALLSAVPVPDPQLKKSRIILQGDVPSPIHPPAGCHFHPRCPHRMTICDQQQPELNDLGQGHEACCFLYR
jgi:oligopeptide/dipeptide ABC transporter ATP-binding protein